MSIYTVRHFGELDSKNLEEYYDTEVSINGRRIEVDISFDATSIEGEKLGRIDEWLANLQKIDEMGLASINEDFRTGSTVKEYIEHHQEELDADDLNDLASQAKDGSTDEEKLLYSIKLKRIGFYPDTQERFISLDYTLDEDLTDYVIVLDYTEAGDLHYITLES